MKLLLGREMSALICRAIDDAARRSCGLLRIVTYVNIGKHHITRLIQDLGALPAPPIYSKVYNVSPPTLCARLRSLHDSTPDTYLPVPRHLFWLLFIPLLSYISVKCPRPFYPSNFLPITLLESNLWSCSSQRVP